MNSSLRERFERLGPVRGIDRVPSGLPAVLSLARAPGEPDVMTVTATISLARRGLTMLRAKRVLEEMLETGRVWLQVPVVESLPQLRRELADCGIVADAVDDTTAVDIASVRTHLALTQEQFALRFGFDLRTLQNWEAGTRQPDRATRSYLRVIARIPREIEAALYRAA